MEINQRKAIAVSLLTAVMAAISGAALAYTDCERVVKEVYVTGLDNKVWITFETGGAVFASENPAHAPVNFPADTREYRDRLYSTAITALISNRKVLVRFTDDAYNCASTTSTHDFLGMWLLQESA